MEIKYRNSKQEFIPWQENEMPEEYSKAYYENNILIKEENFYKGNSAGLSYMNYDKIPHSTLVDTYVPQYGGISIYEYELFGEYKLERSFWYNTEGFNGSNIALYNPDGELIAHGMKDINGVYEYDMTRKYYYNREINPDRELFVCTFREITGELLELYWNNYHLDDDGQESFALWNTPEDLQELIALTGMPEELAKYYLVAEVVPDFK